MTSILLTQGDLDNDFVLERYALAGEPLVAPAALRPCEMYADHGSARPSVTQGHHVKPIYLQNRKYGKIVDGTLLFLCGTCHDNTHAWIYWLMGERKQPDPVPPPRAQALARKTVDWFLADIVTP